MASKSTVRIGQILLIASLVACQAKAPDVSTPPPTSTARPLATPFNSNTTAGQQPYVPPVLPDPGRSAYDAQMELQRRQQEAAQKQAQTAGLLSFLSCTLQSGLGRTGMEGILGCAGRGLQATLASGMSPGYSSYGFMSTGGGMTGGYTTGGYTTGGYTTSGGYTGGYSTGGYTTGGYTTGGYTNGGGMTGGYTTGAYTTGAMPFGR